MIGARWHVWMPVADARCRCPQGHTFRPRGVLARGYQTVRCPQCTVRLVVVAPRGSAMKLLATVSDGDVEALAGLDDLPGLVHLLTTPVACNAVSAVELG